MKQANILIDILRHLRHFLPRLMGYGLLLGTLFGTLTYPIFGTMLGAPWGLAAGTALGIFTGIGIPIYNRFFADVESENYQSKLTIGVGLSTTIVMALPLLFIYAPFAGITTAYVTYKYAETPSFSEKRKNLAYQRRLGVVTRLITEILKKVRWLAGMGILAVLFGLYLDSRPILDYVFVIIFGIIYSAIMAIIIGSINGLMVTFANHLYFSPDMPKSQYKIQVVVLVSVLTLFLSAIVTLGVGAPFAAVAAGLGAAKYADWYYEGSNEEKQKRLDKSYARLEDDLEDNFSDLESESEEESNNF